MFGNVVRIAERADRGVIVWANNGHVENAPASLGGMLRNHFGRSYLSVGSVIGRGQTLALDPSSQRVVTHDLMPAPGEGVETRLLASVPQGALIDSRGSATGPLSSILRTRQPARLDVGFYVPPEDARFGVCDFGARFDTLYFLPVSAPSTLIRTWPDGVPMHDG